MHNSPKLSTKDSQKADDWIILGCWNPKLKKKLKFYPSTSPQVTQTFWTPSCFASSTNMWQHIIFVICSAALSALLFFFPELVKSRLICTDALASPCLPICFFTDFMKDMNCIGCQTFTTSSATFTMCLSQSELVYCSVSSCQERWRLFYGYTDDCLVLCVVSNVPSYAMQLPEIPFPRDSWWLPMLFTLGHLLPQHHCHRAWVFCWDGATKYYFCI